MTDQAKLTDVLPGRMLFDDGTGLPLGKGVKVTRLEGLLVWELDGKRCARIAAGRNKADCESLLRYVRGL